MALHDDHTSESKLMLINSVIVYQTLLIAVSTYINYPLLVCKRYWISLCQFIWLVFLNNKSE